MAEAPVTGLRARSVTVPTDAPEADGTLAWDSTTVVDDLLAPVVVGADALAPAATQAAMVRAVRNAGRPGLVGMALSAVDVALWDLCGRLHELPLHRLWGATAHPVEVYGSGGFTTYDDDRLRAQVSAWRDLGLGRVKIKIAESRGTCEDRDLARVEIARQAAGAEAELFVDANGGYAVGQACRVGRALDELGVSWFEEPVSSDDLAGLRRVRDAVVADVTAGEYGYDLGYFQRMAPSVDCLQVDVTRCGGYTEWLRVSAAAAAARLDVSGHCAPYLCVPVAAATPNLRHLEWFHDHVRIEQRLFDGCPDPIDGRLSPQDRPGHGLDLKETA